MFETAANRLGLSLTVDCAPLSRAGVRRPRPVGQGRAEPALERPEVHLRGRHHGAAHRRPATGAELAVDRHRHRHPGGGGAAPVRAVPPGQRRAVAHPRGLRHRPRAGRRAGPRCTAAPCRRAASLGEGSTFTMRVPFGAAHLPAEQLGEGRDGRARRRRRGGARASSPRPPTGREPGRRPRPDRHRPRATPPRRGSSSSTTTPTSASTSPGCSPTTTPCTPPSTASTGWRRPGRTRRTWCSPT